jgi:hypothetical protein
VKKIKLLFFVFLLLNSCQKDKHDIDNKKPHIDISNQDAFPTNCDTLYFGESFFFKALFTDNVELGSFSIDIHNNFNHHSHSTEILECVLDPIKKPLNPLVIIKDFEIPSGLKYFNVNIEIFIPASDRNGEFDEGDYHFYIKLTDKSGWSTQKGLNIKMSKR